MGDDIDPEDPRPGGSYFYAVWEQLSYKYQIARRHRWEYTTCLWQAAV